MVEYYLNKEKPKVSPKGNVYEWWLPTYEGYNMEDLLIKNVEFEGTLELLDNYRGRSAQGVSVLVIGHPCGYNFKANLSSKNLVELCNYGKIEKGIYKGKLKLAKKGKSYFVVGVFKEEEHV